MTRHPCTDAAETEAAPEHWVVLFTVHAQLCALPVEPVRDILGGCALSPIPLAPPAIVGHGNLRGRVLTAVDLRRRLPPCEQRIGASGPRADAERAPAVVVEQAGALHALLVDEVREVTILPPEARAPAPALLDPEWAAVVTALCRTEHGTVALLDVSRLLRFGPVPA